MSNNNIVTLFRPSAPKSWDWSKPAVRALPPRLPEQPLFYPVLTEEYAVKIARDWKRPRLRHRICHALCGSSQILGPLQNSECGGERFQDIG